ncbi:MAG: hypothetical protein R3F59_02810 [Myxococcota bacterium]
MGAAVLRVGVEVGVDVVGLEIVDEESRVVRVGRGTVGGRWGWSGGRARR